MADFGQLSQVRNILLHLFYCCSVKLNAVSLIIEVVIHHHFRLQRMNFIKTENRKIDPNRSWEVKADSQVFLICILKSKAAGQVSPDV